MRTLPFMVTCNNNGGYCHLICSYPWTIKPKNIFLDDCNSSRAIVLSPFKCSSLEWKHLSSKWIFWQTCSDITGHWLLLTANIWGSKVRTSICELRSTFSSQKALWGWILSLKWSTFLQQRPHRRTTNSTRDDKLHVHLHWKKLIFSRFHSSINSLSAVLFSKALAQSASNLDHCWRFL